MRNATRLLLHETVELPSIRANLCPALGCFWTDLPGQNARISIVIQASGGCTEHTGQEHCQTSRLFPPFSAQNKKAHDPTIQRTIMSFSMPPTGVEPVLCLQKGILSPSCLPISPQRRKNPAYKALLLPQNERAGNNRSEVKIMAARSK